MTSEGDSAYLQNILKNLIGFTITDIGVPDEDGFFNIYLKNRNGEKYFLTPSCDPEGNGPGFLFIEETANEDQTARG